MSDSEFRVSRERYYAVWSGLVILAIALLIAVFILLENGKTGPDGPVVEPPVVWLQTGEKFPVDERQKKFLDDEKIHSIFFINEQGQVIWTGADGDEVKPCGKIIGTRIEGCGLENVSIQTMTRITLLGVAGNPRLCMNGSIDGAMGSVHRTNNPPEWYRGDYPCDDPH